MMKHIGFADSALFWLRTDLTNRTFFVNKRKESSLPGKLSCSVLQGFILGPLIFLLHFNDTPQAVDCNPLYGDDSCLVFNDKSDNNIEEQKIRISILSVIGLLITN